MPPRLKPLHRAICVNGGPLAELRRKVISFGGLMRLTALMTLRYVLFAALITLCGPVFAQSSETDGVASVLFRSGWQTTSGTQMTALDLQLQPGWKTYWRAPGDAGMPPQFDWTASENLQSVRLHWPTPAVFDLNGLRSIGYHDALILPMELTAVDPSLPIQVRLSVQMGVCKDICMPATIRVTGEVSGAGASDLQITGALAARPMTPGEAGVAAAHCSAAPIKDGLQVTARLDMPRFAGGDEAVVFETNDRTVWVSEAAAERVGGALIAVSDMVGPTGAPFALERQGVTVTVIAQGRSVEIKGCPAP